jgi:Ca2+-dependent lipid-binding protein
MMSSTKTMNLTITVHRADSLPVADVTTSDPYVVVKINGVHIRRTRTIEKNLNPVWDESFDYPLSSTSPLLLKFEVYDTDKNKDDDILGYFEISLNDFPVQEIHEQSYKMINLGKYV